MENAVPPSSDSQRVEPLPEEALEFKPVVKIAAGVLLLLSWVCVCFVFYRLGRMKGYEEGLSSDLVAKQVNEEAVRNIAYFLQVASADDKTLLETVQKHAELLSWVKDTAVKHEALGMLLSVLMDRGLVLQAEAELDELLPPHRMDSPAWAARLQKAARCMAIAGKWEKAQAYFTSAEESYRALGEHALWHEALREHAALLEAGCGGSAEERLAVLQGLLEQLNAADAGDVSAELQTLLGRVQLEKGEKETAEKHFRKALELKATAGEECLPSTLACCGAAHLELGNREEAEKYLRAALERRDAGAAQPLFQIMALKDLATLPLKENQAREALELLDAAKALAEPRLPSTALFWSALGEQRGWALYVARDYDASLVEFRRVMKAVEGQDEKLRALPLEGVARCCLAAGRVEDALPAAEECVRLRAQYYPEEKESLGRVYLVLGQACDQAGQSARAAEAYEHAISALPEGHVGRVSAYISRANALTQAQQWEAAVQAWETALPLLPEEDTALYERSTAQLAACRKKLTVAQEPAPARPRTNRNKSSRRPR